VGARRGRGVGLQPSLFTRLAMVEAELLAMKDMFAELKLNQDELRRDRDEWRWRAERVLADLQRGAWWRWHSRAATALDAVTASFYGLLADMQNKLSEMKVNRDELRRGRDQWRSRAERTLVDQREEGGGSGSCTARPFSWLATLRSRDSRTAYSRSLVSNSTSRKMTWL
jgi:hypothetical protein